MLLSSMPPRASSPDGLRLLVIIVFALSMAVGFLTLQGGAQSAPGAAQASTSVMQAGGDTLFGGCSFAGQGQHANEAADCIVAVPATVQDLGDRPLSQTTPRATPAPVIAGGDTDQQDTAPVSLHAISISRT